MKSNFNSLFSKAYAYGDHTHQTLSCTEYVLKYDLENDLMYDLRHFFNKAILYLFITPLLANREQSPSQPITTCLSLSSHPHGSGNSVVPCTLVLNLYFSTRLICFMFLSLILTLVSCSSVSTGLHIVSHPQCLAVFNF